MRAAILFVASVVAGCASASLDPGEMADRFDPPPAVDEAAVRRGAELAGSALAELEAGHVAEAAAIARRALAEDPHNARARAVMAHGLMDQALADYPPTLALWRRAEGELRRATRVAPEDPVVARLHAVFLVADGHLTAAAERVDQGLAHQPEDADLLELGGRVRFDLGDESAAIALLERRLGIVPDDADAAWRLAQCHARLAAAEIEAGARAERLGQAVETFARYRALVPDDADGPLGEAQVRVSLWAETGAGDEGEIGVILGLYETAAQLEPDSVEPLFGRAVVLELDGRAEAARDAYRAALALEPGHVPSMLNLAASLAAAGEPAAARPLLERVLELGVDAEERASIEAWLRGAGAEEVEAAPEPPVTEPPVTEPPVTEPPVTEPPVTEPPVTRPGSSSPSRRGSSGP